LLFFVERTRTIFLLTPVKKDMLVVLVLLAGGCCWLLAGLVLVGALSDSGRL
jgi:hypothetical protein